MPQLEFLVGTYTGAAGNGAGIHHVRLDTDAPDAARTRLAAVASSPSWIEAAPGSSLLLAVEESAQDARILTFRIDGDALAPLAEAVIPGAGPCHVGVHPTLALATSAHYGDGTATLWRVADDAVAPEPLRRFEFSGDGPVSGRQDSSHAHFATFLQGGRVLAIVDLGGDAVRFIDLDPEGDVRDERTLDLPPGCGPRHLAEGRAALYLACELDERVRILTDTDGTYATRGDIAPFGPRDDGAGALSGVKLSPDGATLYVAGRNQNAIAWMSVRQDGSLEPGGQVPCHGVHPRDLTIDPGGRWLLVANQHSDGVAVFAIDPDGVERLAFRGTAPIGSPACILFPPD